jgi:hypothetical protein|tara:strand:+ start:313 stop:612 length:300 start_codon:yes stop_codon:yes gene_type:complete
MEIGSSIPSAIQSGVSGIQKAERGAADAAVQINRLNTEQDRVAEADNRPDPTDIRQQEPRPSLEAEAVNLIVNEHLAKANTKVIKTADDMIGTLIDTSV